MPLVFTQNEVNLTNIDYADVVGEVYEFPTKYRNIVEPGEQFVYYRGRRRADGSSQTPEYFGIGVVGSVFTVDDRFQCSISNYQPFDPPLTFKDGEGYREPVANTRKSVGFFFQEGVRRLDQVAFDSICEAGLGAGDTPASPAHHAEPGYADPADIAAVDDVAMELALKEAKARWPSYEVHRMPHNNPGFDIEIRDGGEPIFYVEVKGTRSPQPRFFISAGEVAHSVKNAQRYSIWIFHNLDIDARTAHFAFHDGAVTVENFELHARQYFGLLK